MAAFTMVTTALAVAIALLMLIRRAISWTQKGPVRGTAATRSQCGCGIFATVPAVCGAPRRYSQVTVDSTERLFRLCILDWQRRAHPDQGPTEMCPPNTDVTVSAIYKCHRHRGLGRAAGGREAPGVAQAPVPTPAMGMAETAPACLTGLAPPARLVQRLSRLQTDARRADRGRRGALAPRRCGPRRSCSSRMKASAAPSRLFSTIAPWSTCWIVSKIR